MNKYIKECFDLANIDKIYYLKKYLSLINNNIKNPPTDKYCEIHHIVPKCWFRFNGISVDNSISNKVKLNIKDHLKAHLLLVYYFGEVKDINMYHKSLNAIHVMTNKTKGQLQKCIEEYGDLPQEIYDEFIRIREEYYKNNRKYSQEYLEKCFQIYSSYDDMYQAFEEVRKQMDFKYSNRRTLLDQFKKYIDKSRYDSVLNKHIKWWQEHGGCQMSKFGGPEGFEKHIKEVNERKIIEKNRKILENKKKQELKLSEDTIKYNEMYLNYQKFGSRYMRLKYGIDNCSMFLEKCVELGISNREKLKNRMKLEINFNGETHGFCEWCRILGISQSQYAKISKIHNKLNIDFSTLLQDWKYGNLDKYDVYERHDDNRSLPKIILDNLEDDDFVRICDMIGSGIDERTAVKSLKINDSLYEFECTDSDFEKYSKIKDFQECFPEDDCEGSLKKYIGIISHYSKDWISCVFNKHNVIPKQYYRSIGRNNVDYNDNYSYLPIKETIKANLLLVRYFINVGKDDIAIRIARFLQNYTGISRFKILSRQGLTEEEYNDTYTRIVGKISDQCDKNNG